MATVEVYPTVKAVRPLAGKRLLVEFDNGVTKVYDCKPLLGSEVFEPLGDEAVFRQVRADDHGYAVIWTDKIDLAESELWINGAPVADEADRAQASVARDRKSGD
jgi:hypothetical protein